MDTIDIDAEADAIRAAAGTDEDDGPITVAVRTLGTAGIVPRPGLRQAALYCSERQVIWLRPGASAVATAYYVAHELAERHLTVSGWRGDDERRDELCNGIAAALVAPRRLVRAATRAIGLCPAELAAALSTSQTIALVRVGEATGRPIAAVLPNRVIVRGEPIEWGDDRTIRRLARDKRARLTRLDITDAPQRAAFTPDGE